MNQSDLEKKFIADFERYSDAIFRFCLLKVSNQSLAEDMTQEVFMRLWQYLKDGKEISNARSLLYTIANNLAKDCYKKKKETYLDEDIDSDLMRQHDVASPETVAMYAEVVEKINDLDEVDKEVLLLSYVEGLPPKDIALIIDETANVVSVRLNRATKRLKQNLHI